MPDLRLKKLANMAVSGVPVGQICNVLQLSENDYNAIIITEDYKTLYEELSNEQFAKEEEFKTINNAWDWIEATALGSLHDIMQWNKDEDFVLRVAAMSNKAQRRNDVHRPQIDGTNGAHAVINLKLDFVNQLNQTYQVVPHQKRTEIEQKATDIMTPNNVEKLLMNRLNDGAEDVLSGLRPDLMPAE